MEATSGAPEGGLMWRSLPVLGGDKGGILRMGAVCVIDRIRQVNYGTMYLLHFWISLGRVYDDLFGLPSPICGGDPQGARIPVIAVTMDVENREGPSACVATQIPTSQSC
jgi:hypothetical protein